MRQKWGRMRQRQKWGRMRLRQKMRQKWDRMRSKWGRMRQNEAKAENNAKMRQNEVEAQMRLRHWGRNWGKNEAENEAKLRQEWGKNEVTIKFLRVQKSHSIYDRHRPRPALCSQRLEYGKLGAGSQTVFGNDSGSVVREFVLLIFFHYSCSHPKFVLLDYSI